MKTKNELTKKEKNWIIDEIHQILSSVHDCSEIDMKEYRKRDKILDKGITEACWNWNYDLPKKEIKVMKSIWEKLKGK